LKANHNDEAKTRQFVTALYKNVPLLDSARAVRRRRSRSAAIGDVLLSWENEAYLIQKEFGAANFEIIAPSISIQAEPPIALVDKVVEKHGTVRWRERIWNGSGRLRVRTSLAAISTSAPGPGVREIRSEFSEDQSLQCESGFRRMGRSGAHPISLTAVFLTKIYKP
jgi:hypothetical protein